VVSETSFDVLIVGGGVAGACVGALLARGAHGARTPLRVALLEPSQPAVQPGAADPRVFAFSRASEHILANAGAWPRILAHGVSAYERMRVWHAGIPPSSPDVLVFDAAVVGEPNLGYIIENRVVQAALLAAFEEAGGTLVTGKLAAVAISDAQVQVSSASDTFATRLLIGADGARSAVREAIGLTAEAVSYHQTAIVATVTTERAHEATAWQRFLESGTLALLPLADGSSSIVWSADETTAAELLAAPAREFERELERQSDGALGHMHLRGARLSFPLQRLATARYVLARVALIGDAAHVVHPLAGQGMNLGLLDAAALAEVVLLGHREGEDPGALRILRRYERWRRSENELMSLAIDAFDRFLAHGAGPVARFAQRGLALVNHSQEAKRFFIRRALGLAGELPRAARAAPP
jgi:2-octaprenylphenol hydroxylase